MHTKTQKNPRDLDVRLTYDLEIQQGSRGCQVHVRAKCHQAKYSGS